MNLKNYKTQDTLIGWVLFVIAAITYLMTLEPTASYWDCPEYITQGYKLEIGHPPGNPIFMLTARFFVTLVGDNPQLAGICINALSGIQAALTIPFLFWTITILVRRLIVEKNTEQNDISWQRRLVIFSSGVCGALMYTWSDTFWFSAVEAEVYAFSSFCTALVVWIILRWEDKADDVRSDRHLIIIAYIIGVGVAVHLLNLLCIPTIVLVFYYRKWKKTSALGSLLALGISFLIIVLILYGLVPGFIKVAQKFELLFVNTLHCPFNSGVLVYALINILLFAWSIYELYTQKSATRIKWSFFLSVLSSGMLFIGKSWVLPVVLPVALAVYLYKFCKTIPVRVFNLVIMSIFVIFVGYSSYAVIIIRSIDNPPMDQNGPDNVFSLSSYLSREQYGKTPLLYGETFGSSPVYIENNDGTYSAKRITGAKTYAKKVKASENEPDEYICTGTDDDYVYTPEMNMLFPRMYESRFKDTYMQYCNNGGTTSVSAIIAEDKEGNPIQTAYLEKPTFFSNLTFFLDYQVNYMYWRYFMWNFAGRQNDLCGGGSGDIEKGNWISGIPFIDNTRLGDQSLIPDEWGKGNPGHNVFYMMPLLLGVIGLLWQAFAGKKGIEQFWVVFFFFFMTGLAIVLYLNQTPAQPRERDYAYAGSFYAFAIWVGMGIAGLWCLISRDWKKKVKDANANPNIEIAETKKSGYAAIALAVVALLVPLQVVSQTWNDHDRSGRYTCRDFGQNYLSSVGENGIIFTNGDNDTFPLWYNQEVEGYRRDVRVVNLSYLSTDWYMEQMTRPAYNSAALQMTATPSTFAYGQKCFARITDGYFDTIPTPALTSLKQVYDDPATMYPYMRHPVMYANINKADVIKNGICTPSDEGTIQDKIVFNMLKDANTMGEGGMGTSKLACLDIIATDINNGFKRPVYFAMTVPESYYLGMGGWMREMGLAYQVVPIYNSDYEKSQRYTVDTDRMYDLVMNKWRWGNLDGKRKLYIDETIGRMVLTHRNTMLDLATELINEGYVAQQLAKDGNKDASALAQQRFKMAHDVLNKIVEKLPERQYPWGIQLGEEIANALYQVSEALGNPADRKLAEDILYSEAVRFSQYIIYYSSLPSRLTALLTRTDMYIMYTYFPQLLMDVRDISATRYEELKRTLSLKGINADEVLLQAEQRERQAIEQQQAQQAQQAQAQSADTDALTY